MAIASVVLHTTSTHEHHLPQVLYLAVALQRAGMRTTVVGPLGPASAAELAGHGVAVDLRPIGRIAKTLRLSLLKRLVTALAHSGPRADLSIGIESAGLMLAHLSRCLGRTRHVGVYFLEYNPPSSFRWQLRHYPHLVAPWLAKRTSLLIDVNAERLAARSRWMQLPPRRLVLRNVPPLSFVDAAPRAGRPVDGGPVRFVCQGSLGIGNGIEPLLAAFERTEPGLCTLTLAGASPDPDALRARIAERFPAGNVRFVGLLPRSALPSFLSTYDVGIAFYPWRAPNADPGYPLCAPNKLYEYLARGLPVLTSDNPSLTFVETEGVGWQVDPDDVAGVAAAVTAIAGRGEAIQSRGLRALELSRNKWNFEAEFEGIRAAVGVLE